MTIFTKIVLLKGVAGACFIIGGSLINDVIFYKANLKQKELDKQIEENKRKMIENLKEAQRKEVETGLNIVWAQHTQEEIDDLLK